MNLFDVVLQSILGDKLLLAETALGDLVVTVLFEDVPAQVSNWEGLVAQLALHLLSMVGQDVLIQVGNLTSDTVSSNVVNLATKILRFHLFATNVTTLFQLSLVLLLLSLSAGSSLPWLEVLSLQLRQNCRVVQVCGQVQGDITSTGDDC